MSQLRISEKITPAFYGSWKEYVNPRYLNIYEKGGRGSSKSTTVTLKVIMNRMKTNSHALCIRQYANTLRHSIRNQVIWGIYHLGVENYWRWSSSNSGDMTMTYIPSGTKIFFEGADGDKIKGWKTPDMPTTDIIFEEVADFKTDEQLTSIKLSILRAELPEGYKYTFFHTYNPPKRKQNWVNKLCESKLIPKNMYVHSSTYLDNPFLPKEFIDEADHVKSTNERRYNWEYLGKPIGGGVIPFENLKFREITDEEFKSFDNLREGIDWGYAVDPFAWAQWHYDKTRRTIYAMNEVYGIKLSNRAAYQKIKDLHKVKIVADSAEPKSIAEMKQLGLRIAGAKKGQGSVEYGEKWLDDLEEIVIDPNRTPNIAAEFEGIDYQVGKDGNIKSKLEDENNHTIDLTRYAFEGDMKKTGVSILKYKR